MKKSMLAAVLIAVLLAAGCGKSEAAVSVKVGEAKEISSIVEASGIVRSREIRNITLGFPGVVEKINIRNGQRVKKGDVLAVLNLNDFNAQIKNKERELSIAKTELRNAQDMPLGKQRDNTISIQRQRIYIIEADLKLLRDKLANPFISKNNVICDINEGIVFDFGYAQGDNFNSSKKLLSIMDLSALIVEADIAEEFIKDVKAGSEVTIHPLSDLSKSYRGKVSEIPSMGVNKNGQTIIPVQITIDNIDEFLMPNFNVNVEIKK